jgi:hypothetical protein
LDFTTVTPSYVNFLNNNSVDIEAFNLDGVRLDGGEYIDVEEVFDASQPTQQRKRTLNYTNHEDLCLVRAWENVSLDAATNTDQTSKRYWQHIEDKLYTP